MISFMLLDLWENLTKTVDIPHIVHAVFNRNTLRPQLNQEIGDQLLSLTLHCNF